MIPILYVKRNDLQPYYKVRAKDAAGTVIDLTGATIVATMNSYNPETGAISATKKVDGAACTVTDATGGDFEYRWAAGDVDTAGTYVIEFQVTPSSGGKFTLPNLKEGRALVHIVADLDAA